MAAARETKSTELEIIPDPLTPAYRFLFKRDAKTGIMAIYQSSDSGKTYLPLVPAPAKADKIGSVLTLTDKGAVWELPGTSSSSVNSSAVSGGTGILTYPDFYLGDEVYLNAIFGFFRVPAGITYLCREIQLSVQSVPDTAITVDLIDPLGTPQGHTATLPASYRVRSNILGAPFIMAPKSQWSMKVLSCGTVTPGENLNVKLVLEVVTT